jgi:hypothetical protein
MSRASGFPLATVAENYGREGPTRLSRSGHPLLIAFAAAASLLLGGCTSQPPQLESEISTFQELPERASYRYALVPHSDQEASLEYRNYARRIASALDNFDWHEVPLADAELVVQFDYAVDGGQQRINSWPVFGNPSMVPGSIVRRDAAGRAYLTPAVVPGWGMAGNTIDAETFYRRSLRLQLLDAPDFRAGQQHRLYEASVVSDGLSRQLPRIVPTLIDALFTHFPDHNDSTRRVIVPQQPIASDAETPLEATRPTPTPSP